MANETEIKYLTPIAVETQRKKYCRFKKLGIKYIDYKDADFLLKFVNEQGKILPRRITGTSNKYQKKSVPGYQESSPPGPASLCRRLFKIIQRRKNQWKLY